MQVYTIISLVSTVHNWSSHNTEKIIVHENFTSESIRLDDINY